MKEFRCTVHTVIRPNGHLSDIPPPILAAGYPQPAAQRHSWLLLRRWLTPAMPAAGDGVWHPTSYPGCAINHRILCWGFVVERVASFQSSYSVYYSWSIYIYCVCICPRVPDKGWRADCWPRQACYVYPSSPGADRRRFSAEVFHNRVALFHIRSAVPYTGSAVPATCCKLIARWANAYSLVAMDRSRASWREKSNVLPGKFDMMPAKAASTAAWSL